VLHDETFQPGLFPGLAIRLADFPVVTIAPSEGTA
jgi:hypothetical protein